MFGNRLIYNQSPGGKRRGLVYQSSESGTPVPPEGWGYPEYQNGIKIGGNDGLTYNSLTFNGQTFCSLGGLSLILYPDYAVLDTEVQGYNITNVICLKSELSFSNWLPLFLIPIFDLRLGNKTIHSLDLITENSEFKISRQNVTFDQFDQTEWDIANNIVSNSFTLDCLVFYVHSNYVYERTIGNNVYWAVFPNNYSNSFLYNHPFNNIKLKGWKLDWNMQLKIHDCPTPYMYNANETIDWFFNPFTNPYGAKLVNYSHTKSVCNVSNFERKINGSSYGQGVLACHTINPNLDFYFTYNNERYLFGNGTPMGIGPIHYGAKGDYQEISNSFICNNQNFIEETGNVYNTGLPRKCRVTGSDFQAQRPSNPYETNFDMTDLIYFVGNSPRMKAQTAGVMYSDIEASNDTYWQYV